VPELTTVFDQRVLANAVNWLAANRNNAAAA
jgi:hypothetical protein